MRRFEQYETDILPRLQGLLNKGMKAEDIYKKFADMAAARTVTIALTEDDPAKALAAVKEILDRAEGKAAEKKTVTHKFDSMPQSEADALLRSRLKDAIADEDEQKLPN